MSKSWRVPYSDSILEQVHALCLSFGGGPIGLASPVSDIPEAIALADALQKTAKIDESTVATPNVNASGPLTIDLPGSPRPSPATPLAVIGLSIRELMDRAAGAVLSAFPTPVWVLGEIQNLARRGSQIYLDLAEARDSTNNAKQTSYKNTAQAMSTLTARAVIWGQSLTVLESRHGKERLHDVLQDGMRVRVLCQVQLYRDRGQISLMIEDIDPAYTKGALALARENLLKELRLKGLDQANKRLVLTPFPWRIGLISADDSRAKSDFLDQLWTHAFPGEVLFVPTPMQGDAVPARVVAAIKQLIAAKVDLIVITRGGGSAADLRWFDAPEIAYAIAAATLPIVAAIGHHEDVAVAEEICYLRQKTPTAAADFIIHWFSKTAERIDALAAQMALLLSRRVDQFSRIQASLHERLHHASERSLKARQERLIATQHQVERQALQCINQGVLQLNQAGAGMLRAVEQNLSQRQEHLRDLEVQLTRQDPSPWLANGWTQLSRMPAFTGAQTGAQTGSGSKPHRSAAIRRIDDTKVGEQVQVRLQDGSLELTVHRIIRRPKTTRNLPKEGEINAEQ